MAWGGRGRLGLAWTPVLHPLGVLAMPLTCRALGASWLQRIIRVKVAVVTRPPRKCCRHRLSKAAPEGTEVSRAQDALCSSPNAQPLTFQHCARAEPGQRGVQVEEQGGLAHQAPKTEPKH